MGWWAYFPHPALYTHPPLLQALADYAALIMDLKHRLKAPEAPVIGT